MAQKQHMDQPSAPSAGFTIVELLVVIAVLALLVSLLLPALVNTKTKGESVFCLNNLRQLSIGWFLYAQENNDRLPNNFGSSEIKQFLSRSQNVNWAGSVLNWELDPDNTNVFLNTTAQLGIYVGHHARVFKCPSDRVLSDLQRRSGWVERSRSISMNAMVGDAGEFSRSGVNTNNPYYHQFLKLSEFQNTTRIFVFIEEHAQSINDGYFLNKPYPAWWHDLPASYHGGAANLTFGDGHAETRRWVSPSTKQPARADYFTLPFEIEEADREDFNWLLYRTSIYSSR
jgi:prepilin-type N-terminal cleavage/methylation domain-containing protein/prepilin-type processing-associated H-X9-DG protein